MCVNLYIYVYICMCIYVRVHILMCLFMYICICVYFFGVYTLNVEFNFLNNPSCKIYNIYLLLIIYYLYTINIYLFLYIFFILSSSICSFTPPPPPLFPMKQHKTASNIINIFIFFSIGLWVHLLL